MCVFKVCVVCISVYVPVLSCSVNTPVGSGVEGGIQVADRKQFWIKEDRTCGKQPGGVCRQQREGVA